MEADLQQQLAKLRSARAKSYRRVQYGDRQVEYKSDSEMAAAIADLERRLSALQGGRVTAVRIQSSKGFE
jgi:hypothetical protein